MAKFKCPHCGYKSKNVRAEWNAGDIDSVFQNEAKEDMRNGRANQGGNYSVWVDIRCSKCKWSMYYNGA